MPTQLQMLMSVIMVRMTVVQRHIVQIHMGHLIALVIEVLVAMEGVVLVINFFYKFYLAHFNL